MAVEDPRRAIDAICGVLRAELEAQLATLSAQHSRDIAEASQTVESAAEARWAAKLDEIQSEWSAHLDAEIARGRTEAETLARTLIEATQAAGDFGRQRDELLAELERTRAQLLDVRTELDELRAAATRVDSRSIADIAAADAHIAAADAAVEAHIVERYSQLSLAERLLAAVRSLDNAPSLSRVLTTLLSAVALEIPRAVLFVMEGGALKPWTSSGFAQEHEPLRAEIDGDGLLAEVWRRRQTLTTSDIGPGAPAFARLPKDRAAIAVPLLVGGQPVAIVYADDAGGDPPRAPAAWPEAIQILCRHASITLAHLTFARAAETLRRSRPQLRATIPDMTEGAGRAEDSGSARRYARLLVSEIKLYNESAVRIGREKRDLLTRLQPEIDRARRLYQQRISSSVDARGTLFQQELVVSLADGDPALLGGSA